MLDSLSTKSKRLRLVSTRYEINRIKNKGTQINIKVKVWLIGKFLIKTLKVVL